MAPRPFSYCWSAAAAQALSRLARPDARPTCGGFFDVPTVQKRLGELNALMAGENFWNNREKAQKLIDEANALRNKIEPLLKAEKQLEDFRVMLELGEAEPRGQQPKVEGNSRRDLAKFSRNWTRSN